MTFVLINLFKYYVLRILVKSPVKRKKLKTKIPAFEAFLWVLYALYAVYVFIIPFPFLGITLLLVLIYLVRDSLLNLIHGIFYRFKDSLEKGQKVIMEGEEGTIHSLNTFDVSFENKEGEIKSIPYQKIISLNIIKKDFSSEFFSHNFSIKTHELINEEVIKKQIIAMPWSSEVYLPKITKTQLEDSLHQFDIIVYTIDRRYFSFIEEEVRRLNETV
jgi:small-conductance mechanosensitive channel